MAGRCEACGAAVDGRVCKHCGQLLLPPEGAVQEREALEELHRALAETDDYPRRERVLENAFLPEDPDTLVEAALRCVPLLDAMESGTGVPEAAARRVAAVVSKLRLLPSEARRDQAVAELEKALADFEVAVRKENRSSTIVGVGCLLLLVLGVAAAIWAWR